MPANLNEYTQMQITRGHHHDSLLRLMRYRDSWTGADRERGEATMRNLQAQVQAIDVACGGRK